MDTFPRQQARTRRFTLGEPRTLTVSPDGQRVVFLRSASGSDPVTDLWVLDVARRDAIRPLSMFHLSERASPFVGKGGRFGMHQFQERLTDTRLYCAWFAGGLRVIDVKDPMLPVETGFYIPEPCGGEPAPQSNDVAVDERGLVYLIDRNTGFDVLEPTA